MAGRNYRSQRDDIEPSTTVYVGNLSYDTTKEALMEEFPGCVSVDMPTDRETGRPRGFAFLRYEDKTAAQEALRNDKMELDGRTLSVNFAKPRREGGGGGGGRQGGYGGDRDYRSDRGYRGGRGYQGDRGYRGGRGYSNDDRGYGGYGSNRGYGRERDDGYY